MYLVKGNHIYPWEIEAYRKIGINKFKLNGRDGIHDDKTSMTDLIEIYLKGTEDIKNIESVPLIRFASNLTNQEKLKSLKVKDVKKYLPKISHFIKYGELCTSRCGNECRYCYCCTEKVKTILNIKEEKETKKIMHTNRFV